MHTHTLRYTAAAGTIFTLLTLAPIGLASPSARQAASDWCQEDSRDHDRERYCTVRQFTLPATAGTLDIHTTNGGIQVVGQARGDVQVEARVVATARTAARAKEIADAVTVNATMDRIDADGPRNLRGEGWSVSIRTAVPRALNVSARTVNGGIRIEELDSTVRFETTNGGVKLRAVEGNVSGRTTNGGVDVDLEGAAWNGEGLSVRTTNGGVRLMVPENYSAELEARTHNGGITVDLPNASLDRRSRRDVTVRLGSGGAPIRVQTSNGGVRVTRK